MDKGNGWVVKWLVGSLWGMLVLAISMTANGVIENDKKNTTDHVEIRKDFSASDEKLIDKFNKKIDELQAAQVTMLVQQTKILAILEKKEN